MKQLEQTKSSAIVEPEVKSTVPPEFRDFSSQNLRSLASYCFQHSSFERKIKGEKVHRSERGREFIYRPEDRSLRPVYGLMRLADSLDLLKGHREENGADFQFDARMKAGCLKLCREFLDGRGISYQIIEDEFQAFWAGYHCADLEIDIHRYKRRGNIVFLKAAHLTEILPLPAIKITSDGDAYLNRLVAGLNINHGEINFFVTPFLPPETGALHSELAKAFIFSIDALLLDGGRGLMCLDPFIDELAHELGHHRKEAKFQKRQSDPYYGSCKLAGVDEELGFKNYRGGFSFDEILQYHHSLKRYLSFVERQRRGKLSYVEPDRSNMLEGALKVASKILFELCTRTIVYTEVTIEALVGLRPLDAVAFHEKYKTVEVPTAVLDIGNLNLHIPLVMSEGRKDPKNKEHLLNQLLSLREKAIQHCLEAMRLAYADASDDSDVQLIERCKIETNERLLARLAESRRGIGARVRRWWREMRGKPFS